MVELRKNSSGGYVVCTQDIGAGSSGKGALNAWLSEKYDFNLATNNYMTNAGHFVELDTGERILNQHLCSAWINRNTEIYINAGAAIDIEVLIKEIEAIEAIGFEVKNRLTIHPLANVITEQDKEFEKQTIKSGSTFKGCGAALARKAMRVPGQRLAKDYDELTPYIKDRTQEIIRMITQGAKILIEGSQGIDLDINQGEWPYTTSRQTTPQQLVADAGIPNQAITNIIGNLRTNPIRINNVSAADDKEICYTGNYWDAKEISWEEIAKRAGYNSYDEFKEEYGFALMTSVTKKVRRVFEFPKKRFASNHALIGGTLPDSNVIYSLNFINFIDREVKGVRTIEKLMTDKVTGWLRENLYPIIGENGLKWIRTGQKHNDMVELE